MTDTTNKPKAQRAGAFDIRTFIALLLGIYGVVLVVMGCSAPPTASSTGTPG